VAFDYGSHRIGVAIAIGELVLARPAIAAENALHAASEIVTRDGAQRVFVGLPLSLSGDEGASAVAAAHFAAGLAAKIEAPVFLVDERYTTTLAESLLRQLPLTGKQRRQIVDSAAAAELLRFILNAESKNPNQQWRPVVV
jgi:putative Holliday junction resolvase